MTRSSIKLLEHANCFLPSLVFRFSDSSTNREVPEGGLFDLVVWGLQWVEHSLVHVGFQHMLDERDMYLLAHAYRKCLNSDKKLVAFIPTDL